MIHIGLCTDNRYAMACGVCVTSLFENNKNEIITVYVLEKGLTDDNKKKFHTLAADYGQKIELIPVDDCLFKGYPTTHQFRLSIYYRFLFASILPKDVHKLIYLDCDTLVLDSLRELWNTDVTDYSIAAVEDQQGDNDFPKVTGLNPQREEGGQTVAKGNALQDAPDAQRSKGFVQRNAFQ